MKNKIAKISINVTGNKISVVTKSHELYVLNLLFSLRGLFEEGKWEEALDNIRNNLSQVINGINEN